MAANIKTVARKVPVEIIQEDMVGFDTHLKYPQAKLLGDCFYTDRVLWGEIWIKDLGKRGALWRGCIRDGQLYLDETAKKNEPPIAKASSGKVPSLLSPGKYKVWLDAFVRLGDFADVYRDDVLTIDDEYDPSIAQWRAPMVPHSKYWPVVTVAVPEKGKLARVVVPSNRFHWLYRLSRLIDTIDQLLKTHQFQVARMSNVSELASHISAFMATMSKGGANMRATTDNLRYFMSIQAHLRNISFLSLNVINYGQPNDSVICFRKHINNLAELVWRMIHNSRFQTQVAALDSVMAEEHRIMLSRLGDVYNRIPKTCDSVTESPNGLYPVGETFPYGEKFAEEFALPYFNYAATESGHPPLFDGDKPRTVVKWLDSTRKYGLTMVNYASIWFIHKRIPVEKIERLFGEILAHTEARLGAQVMQKSIAVPADQIIAMVDNWTEEFERMAAEYAKQGCKDAARLSQKAAASKVSERTVIERLRAAQQTDSAEFKKLQSQIVEIDKKVAEFEEQIETLQKKTPTKLTDRLKEGNGKTIFKAVYWFQGFEIALKGVVFLSAWGKFIESWGEHGKGAHGTAYKGADAIFKTSSLMSSVYQFSGLGRINQSRQWYKMVVIAESEAAAAAKLAVKIEQWSKIGKGLGALADVGSASLATYELFYDNTYGTDLLERYTPGDACGMYAWHLVIWGGKWITAAGSVGGMASKNPLTVKLQAIGYIVQFIGEFGEAVYTIGKDEKSHCLRLLGEVRVWNNISMAGMRNSGFAVSDFLPEGDYHKIVRAMEEFEWRDIDPHDLEKLMGVTVARN